MELALYVLFLPIALIAQLMSIKLSFVLGRFDVPWLVCAVAYSVGWVWIINLNKSHPKNLWRFALEWGVNSLLFLSLYVWGTTLQTDITWWFFIINLPFSQWITYTPIVVLLVSVGKLLLCLFYIAKNYKINKEIW